jgi:hypothetical protein
MKGSHLFWLSRSKGMTVDIWIRDYNPPRCFQKKISGRGKHNAHIIIIIILSLISMEDLVTNQMHIQTKYQLLKLAK